MRAFAIFLGRGGVSFLHRLTGASERRIGKGKKEIEENDEIVHSNRIRRKGGGRKRKEQEEPGLQDAVKDVLDRSSHGDPASVKERICSAVSLVKIQARLIGQGIQVCARTVLRVVRELGYTKQRNRKLLQAGEPHPDRNGQMEIIAEVRNPKKGRSRRKKGKNPIMSTDTKAKAVLGDYQQSGSEDCKKKDARKVRDHDFAPPGSRLPPYGIHDIALNMGHAALGVSRDTAQFAVQALRTWWLNFGRVLYPHADHITILCDGGGSSRGDGRLWKLELAKLPIEVHHYPLGCSKHNLIEHKLFNHISLNWAGKPLADIQTILRLIASATSLTGLVVRSWLDNRTYEKGIRVSDEEFASIDIVYHERLGAWNYTIRGLRHNSAQDPAC